MVCGLAWCGRANTRKKDSAVRAFDTGFMIAASAPMGRDIFCPPGVKSTIDNCVCPPFCSSMQMNLSDSIVSFPKRISSPEKPILRG